MTSRGRILAAYAHKPVDRIPCSPKIYAYLLELYGQCGIDARTTLTPPPVGDVDLGEVKRRIGDRVCLMGYVDLHYVIKLGTPDLIARTVRAAIETAGPAGFILGTYDSIRDGTSIENVRAYLDASRKYGKPK